MRLKRLGLFIFPILAIALLTMTFGVSRPNEKPDHPKPSIEKVVNHTVYVAEAPVSLPSAPAAVRIANPDTTVAEAPQSVAWSAVQYHGCKLPNYRTCSGTLKRSRGLTGTGFITADGLQYNFTC